MTTIGRLRAHEAAVFLFHGVAERHVDGVRNYTRKHLDRATFRDLACQLAAAGHALSVADVAAHCAAGEPFPPYAFALTFDDGFENNYSVAAPILDDLGLPATFYVTTAFIEHNHMAWVDRIEHALEHAPAGSVHLPWADAPQPFADRASRIALLDEIRRVVKRSSTVDPDALADELFAQTGVRNVRCGEGPLDRKMSWAQVTDLASHELFTVGGHGHTHRILSFLDDVELDGEIRVSLELLAQRAAVETTHYSYPEGLEHCFSDRVIDRLQRHDIACCPSAEDGTNALDTSPFHVKRIMVT